MKFSLQLNKFFNKVKPWQFFIVFLVLGFSVFFSGLNGGFQGDDTDQIINNKAVHSLSNVFLFFRSSTFWNGEALVGDFYRPMMTTTYSIIYSFFGANPIAFHVFQLILYISGAFILFLFLRKFFSVSVAFLISIIFLVHPINSQIVFSIPSMQEPLMLFFGISALYVLTKSQSNKSLIKAAALLFLSLLSKETAVVFVCLAVLYEFLYNRDKLKQFIKYCSVPVVLFLILRISSVGFKNIAQSAPIDNLNLGERIIMIPSMFVFYIKKFFYPKDLATSYYWVFHKINLQNFFIPLLILLIFLAIFTLIGIYIYKNRSKKLFNIYVFFAAWFVLGMLPYMQIIALDMTACETWFFCAMTGFLGMIATAISAIKIKPRPILILIIFIPLIVLFGVRDYQRGIDYHSQETLSLKDISVTDKNYLAMNNLAKYYIDHNQPKKAEWYARQSIGFFPAVSNYINLGVIKQKMNDFDGARQAYMTALKMVPLRVIYENIAIVNLSSGDSAENVKFIKKGLAVYPNNNRLWNYLAIEEAALGDQDAAKNAILNAYRLGSVPPQLYEAIMNRTPLDIPMPGSDKIIHIRWN